MGPFLANDHSIAYEHFHGLSTGHRNLEWSPVHGSGRAVAPQWTTDPINLPANCEAKSRAICIGPFLANDHSMAYEHIRQRIRGEKEFFNCLFRS